MDFNPEVRRIQLESLEQFISDSKDKVHGVLDALNWSPNKVLEENHLITCSLDTSHKVHRKNVEEHIRKCTLRKEGYDLDERFLSEPTNDPKTSIVIDDHRKIEVLSAAHKTNCGFRSDLFYKFAIIIGWNGQDPDPKTAERLTCTFSADERLALYDYAVASTATPTKLPEFDILNPRKTNDQPLSYEEKLSRERDAKRRRIKYKTIHTSRKNYTEVLREVITGQMELYKDWLNEDPEGNDCDKATTDREQSTGRTSSHSSSSRDKRKYKEDYEARKLHRRDADGCGDEVRERRRDKDGYGKISGRDSSRKRDRSPRRYSRGHERYSRDGDANNGYKEYRR